jgi:cytochrome b561
MVFRALWRNIQPTPEHLPSHSKLERRIGHITHISLYIIFFLICISGYLITTADGRGIEVFGLFTVPSLGEFIQNQEDIAGSIHEWLAYSIIALTGLHALGALKHHFIDKDDTLKRMLGKTS